MRAEFRLDRRPVAGVLRHCQTKREGSFRMLGLKVPPGMSRRVEHGLRICGDLDGKPERKKHRALRGRDIAQEDVVECGLRFDFYWHSLPA
jgi:hypothetical protein